MKNIEKFEEKSSKNLTNTIYSDIIYNATAL